MDPGVDARVSFDSGQPPAGANQRRPSVLLRRSTLHRTQTKELLRICVDHESERFAQEKTKLVNRASSFQDDYHDTDVTRGVRTIVCSTVADDSSGAEYDTDLEIENSKWIVIGVCR